MPRATFFCAVLVAALALPAPAGAVLPFHFGLFPSGPMDGITDVAGVRVSHVTKIEGQGIRTGATAVLPDADPWNRKVAAAFLAFNGNGELTGTHWIEESGYLEEPVVLTDTLDVGRAGRWGRELGDRAPSAVGRGDDVPLPVVGECDDAIAQRHPGPRGQAADVVRASRFRGAGAVCARQRWRGHLDERVRLSRRHRFGVAHTPVPLGGYRVGVLVNDNTGSGRQQLNIVGVPVGERLEDELRPVSPKALAQRPP